jgi:NADPH:quinone reductase-like Zn-dependent oxidoreductase
MRAVHLTAYGNPVEGLKYVDIPAPEAPGPNQVLIGVEFSPLNPSDLLLAGASMHCARRCQPSSAMKASAAFSPSDRE